MGACSFTSTGRGKTAKLAFENAREQAQYDHGHAGYTGTIAEKNTFVMIESKPTSKNSAELLAYKLINEGDPRIDDKWGPAGCITLDTPGAYLFFGMASS